MAEPRIVPNLGMSGGLWSDPLSYILPHADAEYQQQLQERASTLIQHPHTYSSLDGLFSAFGMCVLFLMLRFLFNGCFQAAMRSHRRSKDEQQVADKVEEELWVTFGGTLLLVVGWQCLLSVSQVCSLADTSGCLRNWPMIPVQPNVLKYYNLELGWYLQLMLKHPLGLGLQDGGTMGAHHLATVALIVLSYMLNVHMLGLLVFCVLNVSNPLLHLSKLANALEMKRAKVLLFAGFAFAFFATRVLLFPYVIIKAAMYDPLYNVRGLLTYFTPFYAACNVLLLVLCVMQAVWFTAVVRVLKAALAGSSKQLQQEMAHDPAGQGSKILLADAGCSSSYASGSSYGGSSSNGASTTLLKTGTSK